MPILGLFHIGVYTKDIDTSVDFYTGILGFHKEWKGTVDHPTGNVEAAVMRLGDCTIELVRPVDLGRVSNVAGPVQHIALKVENLEGILESLSAKGISLSHEGVELIPTFYHGMRHAFIYGPSGERIELAEELNIA